MGVGARLGEDEEVLLALPGDLLSVIEEFSPGEGVYEERGMVYSSTVGLIVRDMEERRISVLPLKQDPPMPRKGDSVLGVVVGIRKDIAEVDIYQVEGARSFTNPYKATLHVSEVDTRYVERIVNAVWPGDVVKAKVLLLRDPYPLSIKEKGMGVLLAFCTKCRYPLLLKGGRLVCFMCGSHETRKTSSNYMLKWGSVEARLIKNLI
ncbi:MAG: RNA-binding protein [Thermoprotei archaeon]|nr:MAG: RNA-binding protein [Thermoprotei archaeon]RLF16315.1 MAG: RNA-binding protein [Thermoprotei archaeon]